VTDILRAGLLTGVRVLVAAPPGTPRFAPAIADRTAALGAAVERAEVDPAGDEIASAGAGSNGSSRGDESSGSHESSAVEVLVWDASSAGSALAAIDGAWLVVRPVAARAMAGGGLIALAAPPPGDPQAEASRAGLETMARTLSIEWARLAIRPVAILPGPDTPASEVAELVAYLASPAGAYFSGCRFELGSA
jgi:NAD(P)-dependent dehydrogenase (short-subunit alcohol dehydrogenase family)